MSASGGDAPIVPSPARRAPPPPLDLETLSAQARFATRAAPRDPFLRRLQEVCAIVDTDDASRAAAGRDWWPLSMTWAAVGMVPALPDAVARPASTGEVSELLALCQAEKVPITPAAGRSGVCGASVPAFSGVALDMTGMSGVSAVDDQSLVVTVRPGTFGDDLERCLRSEFALTLGHWPQSISLSTVGGWLACRSAGQYSTRYGKIEDMTAALEVVLADGRVVHTGSGAPRAAVGPDLTQLFLGSEGTLGVITEARLRVHPVPEHEAVASYSFSTFASGIDACRRVLRRGATPAVVRLYDASESDRNFDMPARCVLIVLDEGDVVVVRATMAIVDSECLATEGAESLGQAPVERWREQRNALPPIEESVRAGFVADTVEVAGAWSELAAMYDDTMASLMAIDGTVLASGHLSHAYSGGGCLYFTFAGRPGADGAGGAAALPADSYYRRAWDAIMATTIARDGALSHHHGVGINRGRHMKRFLGPTMSVLESIKAALDPAGVLNPGKLGLSSPFGDAPWP